MEALPERAKICSMSKQGKSKGKSGPSPQRKKSSLWRSLVPLVVVAALTSSYFLMSRNPSADSEKESSGQTLSDPSATSPALRNRLVLPALPKRPRPIILDPANFPEPEVKRAYQAAKDDPEALENVACYCGCYASSGHRNNLDCFHDNHGVT